MKTYWLNGFSGEKNENIEVDSFCFEAKGDKDAIEKAKVILLAIKYVTSEELSYGYIFDGCERACESQGWSIYSRDKHGKTVCGKLKPTFEDKFRTINSRQKRNLPCD